VTVQNNGTTVGSVYGNATLNLVSGCTATQSASTFAITCAGSGTVSANSGTAGAVTTYAAAGGSTTVGASGDLVDSGTGTLTVGAVGGSGNGKLTLAGTTSGSISIACNAAACTQFSIASPVNLTAASGTAFTGHINQSAGSQWAGKCAMSTSTSCTFSIVTTFTNYLSFVSLDQVSTPPATANTCNASLSGTTVTITCGVANSLTWDAVLIGNPN
jgi:hypothetical protein